MSTASGDAEVDRDVLEVVDRLIARHRRYVEWLPEDAPILDWMRACLQRAEAERSFLAGAPDPQLWDPVVAYFDERGGVPHAAVARLRRATARAAADRGSTPGIAADVRSAHGIFVELGLTALEADATALARRLGVPLDDGTDVGASVLADLTEREREVLLLVARGWSNRDVGEHLFISPKTVSVHMSNAMRKLDVDSRNAAAWIVHRAGLLDEG